MHIKKILYIFLSGLITFSCSSASVKQFDLTTKGWIKVKMTVHDTIVTERATSVSKHSPMKIYFRKLDIPSDLSKGKVFATSIHDDGYLHLNAEPGTYVIIGCMIPRKSTLAVVCFDDKLIKYSVKEVAAGKTVVYDDLQVMRFEYRGIRPKNKLQKLNYRMFTKNLNLVQTELHFGGLNPNYLKYRNRKTEKKKPVEKIIEYK